MKKFLLTLLLLAFSVCSFAQVPPPPDYHENAGTPGGDPGSLPVDQYLYCLIGAAMLLGAYLIINRKKTVNQF